MLTSAGSCQSPSSGVTVATYNLEWFNESANPERITRIKKVVSDFSPQILALQEIQSRKALQPLFDSEWDLAIMDDETEFQEVALAVKKPYKIEDYTMLFKGSALDVAFPGGRDVLRVIVKAPDNTNLVFYVLHMKSRRGGRLQTDSQRNMAAGLLAAYLRNQKDEKSIVLGDFNDCPDDASVNILESGNLVAKGGREKITNPLLVNLAEPLYDADQVSHGLAELFKGSELTPVVKGSKEENEKFRGKDYDFRNDSTIHQSLLDQILVSPSLAKGAVAKIYSSLTALEGTRGRVTVRDDGSVTYVEQGTRASDHLPVYVTLKW